MRKKEKLFLSTEDNNELKNNINRNLYMPSSYLQTAITNDDILYLYYMKYKSNNF